MSWARAERISFALRRARIRCSSGPLGNGGGCRVDGGGGHRRRRVYPRLQRRARAIGRFSAKFGSTSGRGRRRRGAVGSRSSPRAPSSRASSRRIRSAASGSRKLAVPTATAVAPAARKASASAPGLDPAHADHRDRDRGGDPAHLVERDRPHRRPREPAAAGAEPGPQGRRVERGRPQRVDQRDRVGARPRRPRPRPPPGRRRSGSASRSAASSVSGRSASQQRARLGRLLADDQPGLDVRDRRR